MVSTHSRAEAAAQLGRNPHDIELVSTHSRAEAAALTFFCPLFGCFVSTHSRAEAAASNDCFKNLDGNCFNTQPRGGGCKAITHPHSFIYGFNTQPRGGGCLQLQTTYKNWLMFQHTAARRRLPMIRLTSFPLISFNTQPRGGGCCCFKI